MEAGYPQLDTLAQAIAALSLDNDYVVPQQAVHAEDLSCATFKLFVFVTRAASVLVEDAEYAIAFALRRCREAPSVFEQEF